MNNYSLDLKFENEDIGKVLYNKPMKEHTSFKIGGPVDVMIIPNTEKQIIRAVKICRDNDIEPFIMGNGSNLLVRDGGIRGVVIKISHQFGKINIKDNTLYCESGALLTTVSKRAQKHSLTGIEFANGIPGTIGGAMTMNAGAYGGEMKDIVTKVRVLDKDNQIKEYSNEEMNFRYRNSRVKDDGLIVLGVEFQLELGQEEEIKETMEDLIYRRNSKQPVELPSGGSTFKRPTGYYAGKLIDDSGLRGLRHRGAQVSEKHCGFIVNIDNATCNDVLELIAMIQKTVRDNYGVELEREIKLVGEDI